MMRIDIQNETYHKINGAGYASVQLAGCLSEFLGWFSCLIFYGLVWVLKFRK